MAHVHADPPELTIPGIPDAVRSLYRRCVAKEPQLRPSAAEAAEVLTRAVSTAPAADLRPQGTAGSELGTATMPVLMPVPDQPRLRRSRVAVFAAAAAVLFGLFALRMGAFELPSTPTAARSEPTPADLVIPPPPSGSDPPAPAPPPAPVSAASPVNDGQRTFASPGGTVTAACDGAAAYLVSWTAADGFKAKQVHAGPGPAASVTFQQRGTKVEVAADCSDAELVIGLKGGASDEHGDDEEDAR
jgi:hypothetical protein